MAVRQTLSCFPLPPEVVASRTRRVEEDATLRAWVVRHGFSIWIGDIQYEPGDVLNLSDRNIAPYMAQVELLANYVPPVPPEPQDMTERAYRVRPGFHLTWREQTHTGGGVIHFTKLEAARHAHMIEPHDAPADATVASIMNQVKRAVRRGGSVPATA